MTTREEVARVIRNGLIAEPMTYQEIADAVLAKLSEDRSDQVIQDATAAIERCPDDSPSIVLAMAALDAAGPSIVLRDLPSTELQVRVDELEAQLSRVLSERASLRVRAHRAEREVAWYRRLRETQKAAQDLLDAARYGPGVGGGIQAPADRLRKALEEGSYDHPDAPPSRLEPPDLRW